MANTVFFFFSSRRRHTRCSRDWSSDVCSSDLKRREHLRVDLAGVGLTRDGEDLGEAHLQRHAGIELAHFLIVAVEQLEEARLSPRRPLDAAELQRVEAAPETFGVAHNSLHPHSD